MDVTGIVDALHGEPATGSTAEDNASAAAQSYQDMLELRLRDALERVAGLDDRLSAEAEFRLLPSGRTADAR